MLRLFRRAAIVALLGIGLGCSRTPPPPSIDTLYAGLNENLPRLDPSILAGRRIVIDPGHGGLYPGTQGREGLQEAHVNLGVSLYLWGLLNEAGADVFLTRSAERDFVDIDSTVAADLRVRVEVVDSLKPDIFVSIHHNAQPQRDPDKNAVETYYRFGDPASRDLAFAVHRHLMRNLGIDEGEVRPGNYFVLRNVDVPAILGESAYLTHPSVESKLKLSDTQRLEAEAYFLGILQYFSRGTPRLTRSLPGDSVLTSVPSIVFDARDVGGLGIDPGSVQFEVNGTPVTAVVDPTGERISYQLPWDAPNGAYEVSVSVRNLLGNASRIERFGFALDHPPVAAHFDTSPRSLPHAGSLRVRARLVDERGLSIANGTAVAIDARGGTAPDTAVVTRGVIDFPVRVNDRAVQIDITLSAAGRSFNHSVTPPAQGSVNAYRQVALSSDTNGHTINDAALLFGDSIVTTGSSAGIYFVPLGGDDAQPVRVQAPGFQPLVTTLAALRGMPGDTLAMTPWYDGLLLGRRFVIDPEGGFGPLPGIGPLGLSGAYVNLQVARFVAEYLHAAGADVALTRENEETLSPRDVVAFTNRFRADRYLEIRHRAATADSGLSVTTGYFPGSSNGEDLAAKVQRRLAGTLGLVEAPPREMVTFPLQQTACPAIIVEAPSIGMVDEELRLGEPWYQRRQAYGIFLGILEHFGYERFAAVTVIVDDPRQGQEDDGANWLLSVAGTWNLLTSPDGTASFTGLAPGTYGLLARRGARTRQLPPIVIPAGLPHDTTHRVTISELP